MTTAEAVTRLRDRILNRPSTDDLFTDPDDYHDALTDAQRWLWGKIASHYPDLLMEEHSSNPISSSDSGTTYALGGDHYGQLEVWTPPGIREGDPIVPAVPESDYFGYYVEGTNIKLTLERDYNPGIYVRWVPATPGDIDASTDPALPLYTDDCLLFRAAYEMASTPGFLGDPEFYRLRAVKEWAGDPDDISDVGVLGILSKQSAHRSYETLGGREQPWYRRITSE